MATESIIDRSVVRRRRRLFSSFWPLWTTLAQQRRLLRLILASAEQQIPFKPALAAWAVDEQGVQRGRLLHLLNLLDNGYKLQEAIELVPGLLSEESVLTIRLGMQSGNLAQGVRNAIDESHQTATRLSKGSVNLGLYFWLLGFKGLLVATFFQLKIFPEFKKIYYEFNIDPTPAFQLADRIDASMLFVGIGVILLVWLLFASWPGRILRYTLLGRLSGSLRKLRVADLLTKLATVAESGRPLAGAVSTLARYHFDSRLRQKLLYVRNELEQGSDLWTALKSVRLLNDAEFRVMQTSEKLENAPWLLKQLAAEKRTRTLRRLEYWQRMMTPLFAILLGAFVLLQAVAVFSMLTNLTFGLT